MLLRAALLLQLRACAAKRGGSARAAPRCATVMSAAVAPKKILMLGEDCNG